VGASLLAKFFASKLAPTVGAWPNGLSGMISIVQAIAMLKPGRDPLGNASSRNRGLGRSCAAGKYYCVRLFRISGRLPATPW